MTKEKEIEQIREKIYDLMEYLNSEACFSCGQAAILIDECKQKIKDLENNKE